MQYVYEIRQTDNNGKVIDTQKPSEGGAMALLQATLTPNGKLEAAEGILYAMRESAWYQYQKRPWRNRKRGKAELQISSSMKLTVWFTPE